MNRRMSNGLIVLLWLVGISGWVGCSKDKSTNSGNHPPTILSIVADPDTFVANYSTQITVMAQDPDGDQLHYNWEANAAWLLPLPGGGNKLMLTNCCEITEMKTTMVVAIVDDSRGGSIRDSIRIWVIPMVSH